MKQIITLSLLLICTLQGLCQDIFLGTSKDMVTNFYIISITRKANRATVFERVRPADGKLQVYRKQVIEGREHQHLGTEGFDKLGYYRRRIMYDCKGKLYQILEATYYDLYGKEIKTNDPDPTADKMQWFIIPPSSMREAEFIKACR